MVDAYEEFLLLRDLLTKIDDCRAWLRRKGLREQEPCFLLPQFAEVRERVWYIEVSRQRQDEAAEAVAAAAEAYTRIFNDAARHRTDLTRLLARQGLPYPVEVAWDAANRRAEQPWWRRLGYRSTQGVDVRRSRPSAREFGSQIRGLNMPDPLGGPCVLARRIEADGLNPGPRRRRRAHQENRGEALPRKGGLGLRLVVRSQSDAVVAAGLFDSGSFQGVFAGAGAFLALLHEAVGVGVG